MSTPKDKTLTGTDRDALYAFANKNIKCADEEAAFEAAYKAAKPIVLAAVHARFPVKDMKVVSKYGAAQPDKCIQYGGHDEQFVFKDDDKSIPLVPRYGGCSSRSYDWSKEDRAVLQTYGSTKLTLQKALEAKRADYKRLVLGARKFSDVVAVWPAAEAMRARIIPETPQQRALAVLSADAVERIRADNAGAAVKKAA